MSRLIGGRTEEEIKNMIEMCQRAVSCGECPYETENVYCDRNVVLKYAEEFIKRIETERDAIQKALNEALELNAIQAKRKMAKWISVEERLPEEDETVLVWVDGQTGISRIYGEDVNTGGPDWAYTGLGGDPEYWMLLPGAPEEEEHDGEKTNRP